MTNETNSNSQIPLSQIKSITISKTEEQKSRLGSRTWLTFGTMGLVSQYLLHLMKPNDTKEDGKLGKHGVILVSLVSATALFSFFSFLKAWTVGRKEEQEKAEQNRVDETLAVVKTVTQPNGLANQQNSTETTDSKWRQKQTSEKSTENPASIRVP